MECPVCQSNQLKVTNVRTAKNGMLYRRRACLDCGEKFTTYEVDTISLLELFETHFDATTYDKIADIIAHELPNRDIIGTLQRKQNVI